MKTHLPPGNDRHQPTPLTHLLTYLHLSWMSRQSTAATYLDVGDKLDLDINSLAGLELSWGRHHLKRVQQLKQNWLRLLAISTTCILQLN